MKIALGCDHGGYELKQFIMKTLEKLGYEYEDFGCLEAEMTRRHNDANMMAIGAGFTGKNMAERMVEVFLTTEFEGGRHERRVNKMMALEQE